MSNESEAGKISTISVEEDGYDDSVPNWETHHAAVIALQAHEGRGFSSIERGGRDATVVDWDFNPLVLPSYVNLDEHPSDQSIEPGFYTVTNRGGKVTSYQIFNPDLRTEEQPIGAILGEVSERYSAVSYPITYAPLAALCAKQNWDWKITCYDQGKVARMDIIVADEADFGTKRRNKKMGDVYKYGLTIHNSLDGSSGLRVTAYVERLVCTNGSVMMQKRNLASYRHTAGGIGSIDFDKFAIELIEMAAEVKTEIKFVESMRGKKLTNELFDKLQVEASKRGIIRLPKAKPILDPITGQTIDYELQGGHGWRIGNEGWENPDRDWVKVEGDSVGTAFQAYQILTGGLTHKPAWHGPATWNGENHKNINGRTLNLKTLEQRLHAVHILLSDVMNGTVNLEKLPSTEQVLGIELVH